MRSGFRVLWLLAGVACPGAGTMAGAQVVPPSQSLSPQALPPQSQPPQSLPPQSLPPQSLIVDPQQGATPQPLPRAQPPLATPAPVTTPAPSLPSSASAIPPAPALPPVIRPAQQGQDASQRQPGRPAFTLGQDRTGLPSPSRDPLRIDVAGDPLLALTERSIDGDAFSAAIRTVVARNPALDEAEARSDEAEAARNEARALELPVIDYTASYFSTLDRRFSDDPQNILERSRPRSRTDQLLRLNQPVFDFGNARNRIRAGNQRLLASYANIDDATTRLTLSGVQTWYQLFAFRALVSLSTSFLRTQDDLRAALQERIDAGVSAPGDLTQFDSYAAQAQAQLASFRRSLASAEAQYALLTGTPAPAGDFGRAPPAVTAAISREAAEAAATGIPAVEAARRLASASRFEARAVRAQMRPTVSLGVDAGRYGVFENEGDYDVRASFVLNQRFLGGAKQRADQARARARGAEASFTRVRDEAVRDASIAWSDVQSLEEAQGAIRDNYIAARQSRDVLFERFQVARGSLFDVLSAQTNYFNVALRYVETVTELDIARYNLLARTGRLLKTFDIAPAATTDTP